MVLEAEKNLLSGHISLFAALGGGLNIEGIALPDFPYAPDPPGKENARAAESEGKGEAQGETQLAAQDDAQLAAQDDAQLAAQDDAQLAAEDDAQNGTAANP
jgi:hypothetical protein